MNHETLTQEEKIMSAIGYVWLLFLVPLLIKKNNEFCQHHAKQGLVLFIFSLIVSVLGGIPILGWLIILPIGWIIVAILALLGIVSSLQGKKWEMPILGKYAKRINF